MPDSEALNKSIGELKDRISSHKWITTSACGLWMVIAFLTTWAIPLLAGLMTFLAKDTNKPVDLFWLSLIITMLTIVNSTVTPRKRNAHALRYNNLFCKHGLSFGVELNGAETDADRRAIVLKYNTIVCRLIDHYNLGTLLAAVEEKTVEEKTIETPAEKKATQIDPSAA